MNEELNYAEMLEIPVETVTVSRKEKRKRTREPDLQEQLVAQVNDRMEEEQSDPLYAESTPIEREAKKKRKIFGTRRILIGEFIAVCALCAIIFLTNLLMPASAINTFVRGLFNSNSASVADNRGPEEFALSSVVNPYSDIALAVSDSGVLTFRADCAVYAPCSGTLAAVNGDETAGYTLEVRHSDKFSTIMSGLNAVYVKAGEKVYSNVPLAHSDGQSDVRVMFYSEGSILTSYSVVDGGLAWV